MKRKFLSFAFIIFTSIISTALFTQAAQSEEEKTDPNYNRILYVDAPEVGENYLAIMDVDGQNKQRLTPAFNNILMPRYSQASGWTGFTNRTREMVSEIYLLNRTGDRVRRVITDAILQDFSPDGKFFLYTTADNKAELFVYSIERKRANKISQNLSIASAKWSSCGDWIIASAVNNNGSLDIYKISTLAQGIVRVTNNQNVNQSFPVFSRDGKYVVYFTNRYENVEIEFLELETKEIQRPLLMGTYPSLSPENSHLVFQKGNTIAISQVDGLETEILARNAKFPYWIK